MWDVDHDGLEETGDAFKCTIWEAFCSMNTTATNEDGDLDQDCRGIGTNAGASCGCGITIQAVDVCYVSVVTNVLWQRDAKEATSYIGLAR